MIKYSRTPRLKKFGDLVGETITNITNREGEILEFTLSTGEVYHLYHDQDCCEHVKIIDICGDLYDITGHPILWADEATNHFEDRDYDSNTWTFYRLGCIKGNIVVRWHGESNGYYSETVEWGQKQEETSND